MWIAALRQWCESHAHAERKRGFQRWSTGNGRTREAPDATSSGQIRSEGNFRVADHAKVGQTTQDKSV
jgi:hypothetical protein